MLMIFVDDIQGLFLGPGKQTTTHLTACSAELASILESSLQLEVSKPKTLWLTSTSALDRTVASARRRLGFRSAAGARILGVDFSCGRFVRRAVQKTRLQTSLPPTARPLSDAGACRCGRQQAVAHRGLCFHAVWCRGGRGGPHDVPADSLRSPRVPLVSHGGEVAHTGFRFEGKVHRPCLLPQFSSSGPMVPCCVGPRCSSWLAPPCTQRGAARCGASQQSVERGAWTGWSAAGHFAAHRLAPSGCCLVAHSFRRALH